MKYKVVYQWFDKASGHYIKITAFMSQADLAKLLVQPDTKLIEATSTLGQNYQQSRTRKSAKPIAK